MLLNATNTTAKPPKKRKTPSVAKNVKAPMLVTPKPKATPASWRKEFARAKRPTANRTAPANRDRRSIPSTKTSLFLIQTHSRHAIRRDMRVLFGTFEV